MSSRRLPLVLGAALVALAAVLALMPALRAGWMAMTRADASWRAEPSRLRITARMPDPHRLELRFERPNGAVGHLSFHREGADQSWHPDTGLGAPGVLLGDGYPVFATPRFLAAHGLPAQRSLAPVSSAVAAEDADDVTAIQLWGGEILVGLWRHGKIARAFVSGPIFDALVPAGAASGEEGRVGGSACERLPPLMNTRQPASVRLAGCAAAIAGCPELRELALEQLRDACASGDALACDLIVARDRSEVGLWPEIDDAWRWILDMIEAGAGPTVALP